MRRFIVYKYVQNIRYTATLYTTKNTIAFYNAID